MRQNNQKLILISVIIVIIAGLMGALSVVAEGIGITSGKIFATSLSILIYGITATICMVVMSKQETYVLGLVGIFVSICGFVLTMVMIIGSVLDEVLAKMDGVMFVVSVALAHISLLYHFNMQNKYAFYARIAASVFISLFTFLLIFLIFEPFSTMSGWFYDQSILKIMFACFILDLTATLLVPLCNRLEVAQPPEELLFSDEPEKANEGDMRDISV
jgi:hypothetical protein